MTTAAGIPLLHLDHTAADEPLLDPTLRRVMVIYPGHRHATRDVADNVVAGLRANGVHVLPFHYDAHIAALLPLERIWREELGLTPELATARLLQVASDAAFPRALAYRPDLVLFVTGYVFPQAGAALLGLYTRTAVLLTESPYQWETESRLCTAFNWTFTNERRSVTPLAAVRRALGHPHPERVAYLPHGFDPDRHHPRDPVPALACDVCFVGSPFPERQALFAGVDWSGITFRARGLYACPEDGSLDDPERGFVDNDEAHRLYASAKIVINHHRRVRYYGHPEQIAPGEAESLNPRVYELAAAGVFQLCDDSRPELGELFGEAIPTYRADDPADLERRIRYYLAHPEERARLAALARERAQPHTCQARMRVLLDTIFGSD